MTKKSLRYYGSRRFLSILIVFELILTIDPKPLVIIGNPIAKNAIVFDSRARIISARKRGSTLVSRPSAKRICVNTDTDRKTPNTLYRISTSTENSY